MAERFTRIKRRALPRQLSASIAGLRAGGALAVDGAMQKVLGKSQQSTGEQPRSSAFARREAKRFVAELGRLKGTYVKIGQMLALLGEHFLPPVLTEALHDLGSRTEPLPWEEIAPLFEASLGELSDELEIDPDALAAASLAQVHLATAIDGQQAKLCLKLQYPGLSGVIDADFDAVIRMLVLARWLPAGRDLDDWLNSMRQQLHHEIDYQREARLHAEMAVLVEQMELPGVAISVPTLHPRYCSDNVLAMDYARGFSVSDARVARLSRTRRTALGQAMLELFFQELYQWGMLQTDPNFGNYLIQPRANSVEKDGLVLLDFGSVLECEENFLNYLREAIAAGMEGDEEQLLKALVGLGCIDAGGDDSAKQSFTRFCLQLLEPLRDPKQLPPKYLNNRGEYRWGDSSLLRRAGKQAAQSAASRHFSPPSREFALIARKLTGVFTFIAVLKAEFNGYELAMAHVNAWRSSGA